MLGFLQCAAEKQTHIPLFHYSSIPRRGESNAHDLSVGKRRLKNRALTNRCRPGLRDRLEELYKRYNHRKFVHPDPVGFLYQWPDLRDREIVAFTASCLAYGRVAQIHKSVSDALKRMKPSPWVFLSRASQGTIRKAFSDFKHRFTTGRQLAGMLWGLKRIAQGQGSVQDCFLSGLDSHETVLPALARFTTQLKTCADERLCHLVACPTSGSACKRLHLFLRWMVRRDNIDPGGWNSISASKLIVPVDIHMHRVCLKLGLTARKQATGRAALEITEAFREMAPEDPVKYDFVLTYLAIRDETDLITYLLR